MAKHKLQRFEELKTLERVFQFPYPLLQTEHNLKGNWRKDVFGNAHPLVLELGCGRGEYTVALSRSFPEKNFIGIDIKGARLWRGVKTVNEDKIPNAVFLRVQIEWLGLFFQTGEVDEIWITFPDPQRQDSRENRRLTNAKFISMYKSLLSANGKLHLKTDSNFLFDYTIQVLGEQDGEFLIHTRDLYRDKPEGFDLNIQTTYEQVFLKEGKQINYLCFQFNG